MVFLLLFLRKNKDNPLIVNGFICVTHVEKCLQYYWQSRIFAIPLYSWNFHRG